MRIEQPPLTFVFDSRDEVIDEILNGSHQHNLAGLECPACGRLHVHVFTPKLTPFSRRDRIRVPDSVAVDVTNWNGPRRNEPLPATCPACGATMRELG